MFLQSSFAYHLLLLSSAMFSFIITSSADDQTMSIYDVLQSKGLPIGLLPKGVSDFKVDENGRFEVHLDQPCNAKFENQVHYERNVSGNLSYGQIGGLSGISAQELFLWFPVKGIRVDIPSSGLIYFDVGVIKKQFSLSLFETPPDCKAVNRIGPTDFVREGRDIVEAISKSKSGKLRYELDQEDLQKAVM